MTMYNRLNEQARLSLAFAIRARGKKEHWYSTRYLYLTSNLRIHEYGDYPLIRAEVLVDNNWRDVDHYPGPWEDDVVSLATALVEAEKQRTLDAYETSKRMNEIKDKVFREERIKNQNR